MTLPLLLILACAPKVPPPVFAEPIPPMDDPAYEDEGHAPADDCVEIVGYKPGTPPPFIGEDGTPWCRGLLVPQGRYVEFIRAERLAEYWAARARICQDGRERDRRHCEWIASARWATAEDYRREVRVRRAAGTLAAAGAFALGITIGVVAGGIAP